MFRQNLKTSEAHVRMGSGSRRFTLTWADEKQRVALTSAANVSHASHVLCQIHGFRGHFPVVSTFSPNINANLLYACCTFVPIRDGIISGCFGNAWRHRMQQPVCTQRTASLLRTAFASSTCGMKINRLIPRRSLAFTKASRWVLVSGRSLDLGEGIPWDWQMRHVILPWWQRKGIRFGQLRSKLNFTRPTLKYPGRPLEIMIIFSVAGILMTHSQLLFMWETLPFFAPAWMRAREWMMCLIWWHCPFDYEHLGRKRVRCCGGVMILIQDPCHAKPFPTTFDLPEDERLQPESGSHSHFFRTISRPESLSRQQFWMWGCFVVIFF